jgi:hypothetical protein
VAGVDKMPILGFALRKKFTVLEVEGKASSDLPIITVSHRILHLQNCKWISTKFRTENLR